MKTLKDLAPAAIVYLCFAFILWELNPTYWHIMERAAAVACAIIITAITKAFQDYD
jgi:hypothetical protein